MDVEDIDSISLKFRTMNTNDKDHLINEFRRLSKTDLSSEGCCFYMDLAEWNLNTALWAYYEYAAASGNYLNISTSDQSVLELPQMKFLCDVTIGEGESVAPNTNFVKKWRILNCGTKKWPYGCQLKYVNGYNFKLATENENDNSQQSILFNTKPTHISQSTIRLDELEPNASCEIIVHLKSPEECQMYQCQMKLFTQYNQPFGDPIWLLLNVEQGGVLGITQQLNSVSVFNGANKKINHNPFSSSSSSSTTNSNLKTVSPEIDEEKRPDFYDDMFS